MWEIYVWPWAFCGKIQYNSNTIHSTVSTATNYVEVKFDENLTQKFKTTSRFCDWDICKFCLMLRKGIYPYKYMNSWQKFNEASRSTKKWVCSKKNWMFLVRYHRRSLQTRRKSMERFWKKNLGQYYNLHVESDTLLPVDIFGSFRNNSLEIYEVDPAYFI